VIVISILQTVDNYCNQSVQHRNSYWHITDPQNLTLEKDLNSMWWFNQQMTCNMA